MSVALKTYTIGELFTINELKRAAELLTACQRDGRRFNSVVINELLTAEVLARINRKTGQENDPRYLGYMLEFAVGSIASGQ